MIEIKPLISIIIKTLNEEKRICKCIESALAALHDYHGEVILADSGSTDGTLRLASAYPIKIVRLADRSERRCGIGPQLGYQYSIAPYVYILDGDMELDSNFLRAAIHSLDRDPQLAGVAGLVREYSEENVQFRSRVARNEEGIPGPVDRLNMGGLYRREAVDSVGYISNRNLFAHEEQELGRRLQEHGWTLRRIPEPALKHFGHTEPTFPLIVKRWRSGYLYGAGQFIRASLRKPYLASVLYDNVHILLALGLWIWLLTGIALLGTEPVVLGTWGIAFGTMLLQRIYRCRSLQDGVLSILIWHVNAIALVIGFLMPQADPNKPVDAVVLRQGGQVSVKPALLLPEIDQMLAWLKHSSVQHARGVDRGGIHAWIDTNTSERAYLFTEVTGYYATLASHICRAKRDPAWRAIAFAAGDWIAGVALQSSGLLKTRKLNGTNTVNDPFCFDKNLTVLFDNCMAGYGLMNLHSLSGESRYLEIAITIADACIDTFFDKQNKLQQPIYDLKKGQLLAPENHWSRHGGSFHLKCALFFATLAQVSGNDRYIDIVNSLIDLALESRQSDGRFVTHPDVGLTHLHPHIYTVEGLLFLGVHLERDDLLQMARAGIDFAFRNCLDTNGTLLHCWPRSDDYCAAYLRSDVLAQCLRAYYISKLLDPAAGWDWEHQIPALQAAMSSMSLPAGGTSYGRRRNGELIPHANSWCHMFRTEMLMFRYCYERNLGLPGDELIIT